MLSFLQQWTEQLNKHFFFPKEDIQMANKHTKWSSISLSTREIQIKTKMRYQCISASMTKRTINNKCLQGYGEKGTLMHGWWECKLVQPWWKTVRGTQKIKARTTIWFSNSTLGYLPEENENTNLKSYLHVHGHCSIIYNGHDMETTMSIDGLMDKDDGIHTHTHTHVHTLEYYSAIKNKIV